jgi:hypothetical protein
VSIREFSFPGVPRAKVAFFPDPPLEDNLARFKERNFECVSCSVTDLQNPEFVASLDAVVFSQEHTEPGTLAPVLRTVLPKLLHHDVRAYVRIASDPERSAKTRARIVEELLELDVPIANLPPAERERIPEQLREREGSLLAPYVYLIDSGVCWISTAHLICDHPAGPRPHAALKIEGYDLNALGAQGHEERILLVRRAFHDCETIHIKPMADGLSGAPVFRVYASLRSPVAGNWPYLHFMKIGPRKKIADEYDHYIGRALDYVPFHLGPRLRLERCNLGATQGILVGDFVEGAEPIRDCAATGRAGHAIANLFDKTLGAWRKQAREDTGRALGQHLEGKWLDEQGLEISLPHTRTALVETLGGNALAGPARLAFRRYANTMAVCGPAHGDLHATNVLVRGGDAIIIDFEKTIDHFPLLFDPASLEGGLLVEGLAADPRSRQDPAGMLAAISPLYELDVLEAFVTRSSPVDPAAWFYDCVGQIRTLSRPAERSQGQYALVLALCLLRKGCNPASFSEVCENLRAIAFVLGQRILKQLELSRASHPEPSGRRGTEKS